MLNKIKTHFIAFIILMFVISSVGIAQEKNGHKHNSPINENVIDNSKMNDKNSDECSSESSCCSNKETVQSKATQKPWNEVCPVLGNKVDTSVKTVAYNGKAYGFCCAGCDSKFSKNPEKYSKNLDETGKIFLSKKQS